MRILKSIILAFGLILLCLTYAFAQTASFTVTSPICQEENVALINTSTGAGNQGGWGVGPAPADAACGTILPVTFRDFRGNGETGGHVDFELSNLYPAGGSNWPSDHLCRKTSS